MAKAKDIRHGRGIRHQSRGLERRTIIESTGRFKYIESIAKKPTDKGVYIVEDSKDNTPKALKIIWSQAVSHEKLNDEWNLMREVNANNGDTTHLLKLCEPPLLFQNVWGLLMELADDSLDGYMGDGEPILFDESLRFIKEACLGVREVHNIRRTHADLKPANLLLFPRPSDDTYFLVVADFASSTQSSHPTSTEKGTLYYMAPEVEKISNAGRLIHTPIQ